MSYKTYFVILNSKLKSLMGLFSVIGKIANVISDEINTPKSFKDGQAFEDYVEKYLFPPNYYDLLEKTHNYRTNSQNYVEASKNPDFKYRDRYTKKEFYVEAKFRSHPYNNKFEWCKNENQLARYQSVNRRTPVFVVLGIAGKPNSPDYIALIPLSKAQYTGLYTSVVGRYIIEHETPVTSEMLWISSKHR